MLRPHQTTQKSDKNEDLTLPLLNVKDLDSSKQIAESKIVAALMNVRLMQGRTLLRPSGATGVLAFLKQ